MNIKTMKGTRKINTALLSLLCLQHKTQARVLPQSKSTLWVRVWTWWTDLGARCRDGLCAPAHLGTCSIPYFEPPAKYRTWILQDIQGSLSSLHPKGNSLSPSFNEVRTQIKHKGRLHPLRPLYSEGISNAFHLTIHKSKEQEKQTDWLRCVNSKEKWNNEKHVWAGETGKFP